MMTPYEEKTPVIHFAQLALDCYNDPNDDNIRKYFNKLWVKVDQWPRKNDFKLTTQVNGTVDYDIYTGLYAAFYVNSFTGVGVIAIRGTSSLLDGIADEDYAFDKFNYQFSEAKNYAEIIKSSHTWSALKKKYICGHSLGGIVAKVIAPMIGFDAIAFNSPGVKEYLKKRHPFYAKKSSANQRIVTYCAKGDTIGNFRHDNDFEPYVFIDVNHGQKLDDKIDRLATLPSLIKESFIEKKDGEIHMRTPMTYHSMKYMYTALKTDNIHKNDRI